MSWVYLDDSAPNHPKLIRAGAEAAWLWNAGLCYSNRHRLDGRIAKDLLPALYSPLAAKAKKLATKLCECGLWHDRGDHYEIHDYSSYQERALKASQETRQEYERERKRAQREARMEGSPGGKVYFARSGDLIKIGFSKNPWARLESLRTASGQPVELIGHIPGSLADEANLHTRFAHLREAGEWFRYEGELEDYLRTTVVRATVATNDQTTVVTTSDDYQKPVPPATRAYPNPSPDPIPRSPLPPVGASASAGQEVREGWAAAWFEAGAGTPPVLGGQTFAAAVEFARQVAKTHEKPLYEAAKAIGAQVLKSAKTPRDIPFDLARVDPFAARNAPAPESQTPPHLVAGTPENLAWRQAQGWV